MPPRDQYCACTWRGAAPTMHLGKFAASAAATERVNRRNVRSCVCVCSAVEAAGWYCAECAISSSTSPADERPITSASALYTRALALGLFINALAFEINRPATNRPLCISRGCDCFFLSHSRGIQKSIAFARIHKHLFSPWLSTQRVHVHICMRSWCEPTATKLMCADNKCIAMQSVSPSLVICSLLSL